MLPNPAISAAISLEYLLERKNFGPLSRSTESEILGLGPRSPNAHRSVNSDTHTEVKILSSIPHITQIIPTHSSFRTGIYCKRCF